jgi:hypothetical protein
MNCVSDIGAGPLLPIVFLFTLLPPTITAAERSFQTIPGQQITPVAGTLRHILSRFAG